MKFNLTFLIMFFAANIFAQTTGQFSTTVSWSNDDGSQTRDLEVFVPTNYNPSNTYSLVIAFHGLGDNPANFMYKAKSFASFGNVIVACPSEGTASTAWMWTEDYGIVKAVNDEIKNDYNIGYSFTNGFSYGGKAAYVHGMLEANEIKGIIAYSPAFYGYRDLINTCNTSTCTSYHQDFPTENAPLLPLCASAGAGETVMTAMSNDDFYAEAVVENTYHGLTKALAETIHTGYWGGEALWIENSGSHDYPSVSISQQCWNFVNNNMVTDIEPIEEQEELISVYPQPSTGIFNIEFPDNSEQVSIEVFNINGIKIFNTISTSDNYKIDITGKPSGIYIAKIIIGSKIETIKLNLL